MEKLEYSLSFNTPAFIGNERQDGQLRTPPFKALIRHWWRVVWVSKNGGNIEQLRACENFLFGTASGEKIGSQKSKIRIRLPSWDLGTGGKDLKNYKYLLYGKESSTYIQPRKTFTLQIALPNEFRAEIETTMALIHYYGTIGGKSRNGWGSIHLESSTEATQFELGNISQFARDWKDALEKGWPHAIGKDEHRPLIWQTEPYQNWENAMNKLTQIRKDTSKAIKHIHNARQWLSYPVKGITIPELDNNNCRIPNALRFKVRIDPMNQQRVQGIIYFVPSVPKEALNQYRSEIHTVWDHAFGQLDQGEFGVKRTNQ